jgi:hypothetical protein
MELPQTLNVLMLRESGWVVAHALECNIAAQGRSVGEAQEALSQVLAGQMALDHKRQRPAFSLNSRAPDWYWRAFKSAEPAEITPYLSFGEHSPIRIASVRLYR